jgi:hypothetical protein
MEADEDKQKMMIISNIKLSWNVIEIKLNKMPFPGNYELDFKTAKKNKILESLIIQVSLTYVLHFIYIYRFRCNTL